MPPSSKYGFPAVTLATTNSKNISPVTATRLRFESWIQEQLSVSTSEETTSSPKDIFLKWTTESTDIISAVLRENTTSASQENTQLIIDALSKNTSAAASGLAEAAILRIARPDRLEFSKEVMKAVARIANNASNNKNNTSATTDAAEQQSKLTIVAQNAGRYFAEEITTLIYDIFDLNSKKVGSPSAFLNPANNKNFQVAPPLHDEYYGRLNFALRWIEVVSTDAAVIFASSASSFTVFHDEFKKTSRKAYDSTFRTLLKEYVEYILTALSSSATTTPLSNRLVYVHFALLRLRRLTTIVASMSTRAGGASAKPAAAAGGSKNGDTFESYHQEDDSANIADLSKLSEPSNLARKLIHYCGVHHEDVSSRNATDLSAANEEEQQRFQLLKNWQQLASTLLESSLSAASATSTLPDANFAQMPSKPVHGLAYEKNFNTAQVSEKHGDLHQFVKHFGHSLKSQLEKVQIKILQNQFDRLAAASQEVSSQKKESGESTQQQQPEEAKTTKMSDAEVISIVEQILSSLNQQEQQSSQTDAAAVAVPTTSTSGLTESEISNLISKHLSAHAAPVVKTWVTKQRYLLNNKLFTPETISIVNNKLLLRFFKDEVMAAAVDRTFSALASFSSSTSSSSQLQLSGPQALATIGSLYRADPLPEKIFTILAETTKQLQKQQSVSSSKPVEPQLNLAWNLVRETLVHVLADANPKQQQEMTNDKNQDGAEKEGSSSSSTRKMMPLATFMKNEDNRSTDAQVSIFGAAILMLAYNLSLEMSSTSSGTGASSPVSTTAGAFPSSSSSNSTEENKQLAWSAICNFLNLSPSTFQKISPKKQVVAAILRLASTSESGNCQHAAAIVLAAVPSPIVMPPIQASSSSSASPVQLSSQMCRNAVFQGMFRTKPLYCPTMEDKLVDIAAAFTHIFAVESAVIKEKIKTEGAAASNKKEGKSSTHQHISGETATAALHTTIALQLSGRSFPMLFFCPYTPTTIRLSAKDSQNDLSCSQSSLVKSVDSFWYDLSRNSQFSSLIVASAKRIGDRVDHLVGDVDLKAQGLSNPTAPSIAELQERIREQHALQSFGGRRGPGGRHVRAPPPPQNIDPSTLTLTKTEIVRNLAANGGFAASQDAHNIFFFKSLMMLVWLIRYDSEEKKSEHALTEVKHIIRSIRKRLVDGSAIPNTTTQKQGDNNNNDDAASAANPSSSEADSIKINNSTAILAPLQMIAKLLHREDLIATDNNNIFFKQPRNSYQDNASSSSSSKHQHVTNLLNLPWHVSCANGGALFSTKWKELDDRDKAKPYSFIDTQIRSFEVAFRKAEHDMATTALRQPARNGYSEYEKLLVTAVGKFVYDKVRDVIKQPQALKISQTITQAEKSSNRGDIQSMLKSYFSLEKVLPSSDFAIIKKKKDSLEKEKAEIEAKIEQHQKVSQDGEENKSQEEGDDEKKEEATTSTTTSALLLFDSQKESLNKRLVEINTKLASTKYSLIASSTAHIAPQDFLIAFARNISIFVISGNPVEAALFLESLYFSPYAADYLFNVRESVLHEPFNLLKELVDIQLRGMIEFLSPIELYNYSLFLRLLFTKVIAPLCKRNTSVVNATPGVAPATDDSNNTKTPKYLTSTTFPFQYLFKNSNAKSILPVEIVYTFQTMPYTLKDLILLRSIFTIPELRGNGFDAINSYEIGTLYFIRQLASPTIPVFSFLDVVVQLRGELVHSERGALALFSSHYKNAFLVTYRGKDGVSLSDKDTRLAFGEDQRPKNANTRDFADLMCGRFFDFSSKAAAAAAAATNNSGGGPKIVGALGEFIEIRSLIYFYCHPVTVIRGHPFDEQKFQAEEETAKIQRKLREELEAKERAEHEERRKKRDAENHEREKRERKDHKRRKGDDDGNEREEKVEDGERSKRRSSRHGGDRSDRHRSSRRDRERGDGDDDRKKRDRRDRERDEEKVRGGGRDHHDEGRRERGRHRGENDDRREKRDDRDRERDRHHHSSRRQRSRSPDRGGGGRHHGSRGDRDHHHRGGDRHHHRDHRGGRRH